MQNGIQVSSLQATIEITKKNQMSIKQQD